MLLVSDGGKLSYRIIGYLLVWFSNSQRVTSLSHPPSFLLTLLVAGLVGPGLLGRGSSMEEVLRG